MTMPATDIFERVKKIRQKQLSFLTAEQAKQYGFDIDPGWGVKIDYGTDGQEPKYTYVSPEKWEYSDIVYGDAGDVIDYAALSPEGEKYTKSQLELPDAYAPTEIAPTEIAPEEVTPPVSEREYATTKQFELLKEYKAEGTLAQKKLTRPLWLTYKQAIELGYEVAEGEDYLLSPTAPVAGEPYGGIPQPTITEGVPEVTAVVAPEVTGILQKIYPEMYDPAMSYGYSAEELPAVVAQNIQTWANQDREAFLEDLRSRGDTPETRELLQMCSDKILSEEMKDDFFAGIPQVGKLQQVLMDALPHLVKPRTLEWASEYFSKNPDLLRRELITTGRNIATEKLVRQLYPDITEQQMKDYFSLDALVVEKKAAEGGKGLIGTFTAGVGDLVTNIGGVFNWLGKGGIGEKITKAGQYMQVQAAPVPFEPDEFTWKHLVNPQTFLTYGVRMVPSLIALAVPAVGAYGLAGSVAAKIGIGGFGRAIITGVGGAALSRPIESALEAGAAYDEARSKGLSHEEAERVADKVFKGNLTLVGLDALQIAVAFMPTPLGRSAFGAVSKGLVTTGKIGAKLFFTGLTEGGEEVYQEMLRLKALGDESSFAEMIKNPEMQLVFSLGAGAGLGMGAGGDIIVRIQNKVVPQLDTEQKAQFDTDKADFISQGLPEDVATQNALDDVVEANPELEKVVEDATKVVEKEITFEQIEPKDEADSIAIEHLKKQAIGEVAPEAVTPPVTAPTEAAVTPTKVVTPAPAVTPRPTTKQAAANAQRLAKEREAQVFKETEAKFTEEAAATETISKREARRKVTPVTPGVTETIAERMKRVGAIRQSEEYQSIQKEWRKVQEEKGAGSPEALTLRDKLVAMEEVTPPVTAPTEAAVTPPVTEVTPEAPPAVEVKPEVATVEEVVPEADVEVRRQLDELTKIHDYWRNKLVTSEQTKVSLAKFVKENLPLSVRGRYLNAVARIKTDAQLQTQMAKVQEFAELNAQKTLKAEIRKEIKKARAKIKEHILKGKFTPEVQRRLDVIDHNLELDRDIARDKMSENIAKFDNGELGYEEMLEANESLNFAGIEGMSAEELANTLEYIKILETVGRSERQAKQEAATERIKAIRTDIGNILTGGQGLKTGIGAVPRGELAAKTGWWDAFTNWQYGIDNLADKLSKLDPTSKPFQSAINKFVAQVHRATNRQVIGTKDAYNKVKDTVTDIFKVKGTHDINQVLNSLDEEVNLGTFELTEEYKEEYKRTHDGKEVEETTFTLNLTRDEMIAKYMQMQDPTLDNTFTTGMGWSQQVRDAVESNLTEQEKALANAYFEFYEGYYNTINPIYQELYNVDMPHNPKYSPIRRDFEGNIAENLLTYQDASQYASVLNGSLKARVKNIRPLRFNGATKILSNHIEQMEHFKAWATTMRDLRRMFGSQEIRQAIEQYHGRGVVRLIDNFMNQMARGGVEMAATNRAADYLRRAFTKSILAIKPVIALKQIPSLFAYISEMNVPEFFTGIAKYWSNPVGNFKFLYENSEMFRARVSVGFERDIRAAMEKHGKKAISGQGKFTDWFLLQIRAGDVFAVTQGMWAKYQAGLKQGLSQADAIAAAEDTTGRTQPSFGIDTLSAIQNGGSWLKLMTMFQNQPNKYFRIEADALRNFKYGRGSRAKAASTILLVHVILPMMFQFIADAFQWKPERQARAGILGGLNYILIGGQLVQSAWGWVTDQPFDYQASPVMATFREVQMAFLKAKKLVDQGLDPYEDISADDVANLVEHLAKAGGQVTGLPTPYVVQVEKGIREKIAEGEDVDIKDFLFSQWALEPPKKNAEEKVEESNLKLGELKEGQEEAPLTEKELKIYTTVDWFKEIGSAYSKVLPQNVIDNPRSSTESKAWAESEIARSKADILPDVPLYKINTEDNGDTIINYYQQWQARQRIASLEKLKEFDQLYPKAYLGNVTRQQYDLLKKYLEAEDKDAFLETHDGLRVNPRNDWLKANPTDNALLALRGDATILTIEAYNEFERLIKELDIPEDAIPELTLPPRESAENYFERNDIVGEFGANSWEDKLVQAKNPKLREWLFPDSNPIETPLEALELKVEHRGLFDEYDALETDEERAKLKADNPEWVDDMRRIEAIEKLGEDFQDDWVDRGHTIDEFGAGSSEAKVWLLDHPDIHKWAIDNGLLTDDGSDWDEERLRANVKWKEFEASYVSMVDETGGASSVKGKLWLLDNPEVFEVALANGKLTDDGSDWNVPLLRLKDQLEGLDKGTAEYKTTSRKIEAYTEGFTGSLIDDYVAYYELPVGGFRQERYLIEHPEFAAEMKVNKGIEPPGYIPPVEYDELLEKETRTPEEDLRIKAYDKKFPTQYIDNYVEYYTLDAKGYAQERYLKENKTFYLEMKIRLGWTTDIKWNDIPTEYVENLYKHYVGLPAGKEREDFRYQHPELDSWMVITNKVSKSIALTYKERGYTPMEKAQKEIAEARSKLFD